MEKYLTHKLTPTGTAYEYKCVNCNIILFKIFHGIFYMNGPNQYNPFHICSCNCKEYIIKNIIE